MQTLKSMDRTSEKLPKFESWSLERSLDDGEVRLNGVLSDLNRDGKRKRVRTSPVRALAFLEAPDQSVDCIGWQPARLGAFTDNNLYDLGHCENAYQVISELSISGVSLPVHFLSRSM